MLRSSILALAVTAALAASCFTASAQTSDSAIDPAPLAGEYVLEDGVLRALPSAIRVASFQRSSGQNAGGPANDLNTGDTRAWTSLSKGDVIAMVQGRDLYHGNYCGPGDRGRGLAATDVLDEACRRHDACYDAAGLRDCACDTALKQEAMHLAEDHALSRTLRARAASVAESTAFMGCVTPQRRPPTSSRWSSSPAGSSYTRAAPARSSSSSP